MSEVAEKAAEATAEVVEEAVDGVVEVVEVVRNNPAAIAAAALVGVAAGGVGGYFIARKRLKSYYEDLASMEIAEAKEFYKGLNKVDDDGVVLTPMQVLEKTDPEAAAALRKYRGEGDAIAEAKSEQGEPYDDEMDEEQMRRLEARLLAERPDEVSVKTVHVKEDDEGVHVKERTVNVFNDPTFDFEEEKKYRTEDKPYIITHDEFYAAELNYDTLSWTYFELDKTLTDERSETVEDVAGTVGEDNLARFGHGSRDKNVVYVRNDQLQVEYEIARSMGSYLEEVLGMLPDKPNG